jgi:hypothetical protein
MCFVVLKTPLQTFILRHVVTYFLEILGKEGNAFPQLISLCVLMADTCLHLVPRLRKQCCPTALQMLHGVVIN